FNIGRTEFLRDLGCDYRKLESSGIIFPVIESGCKHFYPAYYDDVIIIKVRLADFKGVRMRVAYEIINGANGKKLAEGYTLHGIVDGDLKPVRVNRTENECLKILIEAMKEEENA
ncbi:MAG: hypothetical protein C0604_03260, partial [Clostridiales bacterium]